ncbi:MAG TPA: MFS transporter [Gaiellaceae bacterium]|nr:MFS transporter [Gaiellaceae bacterium]
MSRTALRFRTKLLYASDSLGSEALIESRGLWLLYYYSPPAHGKVGPLLPLLLAGAVLTALPLFSALADPLVGYWSDRTSSRLGRRLPFILAATPLWALFSFLLFAAPRHSGTTTAAAYLALMLALYSLSSISSGGPYEALLPEIATSSNERVSVNGLKVYFGAAGGAIGLVGSSLIVDRFGFRAMALFIASLALVFRYIGTAGIWKRASRTQAPAQIPLRRALRAALSNRYFLLYLPGFVLFQVGLNMTRACLPYYVKAILGVSKTGTWVAILTAVLIGALVLSIPAQSRLARRTSKRLAFRRAMLGAAVVFSLLAFVGFLPGVPKAAQIVVVMALAGLPVAGVYLFPATLTADVIDYDSLETGFRREATYYQLHSFVEQVATSLSPAFLAGLLLLGDTSAHPLGVRLVGPAAGLLVLGGYLVFRRYDLPDEVLASIP